MTALPQPSAAPGGGGLRHPDGHVRYPDDLVERYCEAGFWRPETLGDLLRTHARRRPARPALVADGRVTDYGELDAAADRLAGRLALLGIAAGDRVVVQLPNCTEFVLVLFAFFRMGAVPVLALPTHRKNEIDQLCRMTGAVGYTIPGRGHEADSGFDYTALAEAVRTDNPGLRHVLLTRTSAGTSGAAAESAPDEAFTLLDGGRHRALPSGGTPPAPARPDPAAVALLLLSGGTTGAAKLIPRTHRDYAYNLRASARLCGLDDRSVYLAALPAAHNFALGCPGVLGTLSAGGTVVLAPDAGPDRAFALIERERVTVSALTPPLLALWLAEAEWTGADLSSLALLQVGGARLGRAAAERVRPGLGCRLQQVFGMAEGLLCFTRPEDPDETVLSTQGRPLSAGDELRVVDAAGREVRPGEVGQLLTRGPYTVRGYYRAPETDATAFTADGYYRTGDLVRITPTGHLVVEGRVKDVINRGGEKVPAAEVEDHLLAHPLVAQVALVGVPDAQLGERSCAFVVPRAGTPGRAELAAFLRARGLAAHKLPDRVELVAALPRTGAGKVDKRALAAPLAAAEPADRAARSAREPSRLCPE
ncbi:(2,3-dihydroxybenzoyl)adenylate synthase [Kitasatospora kazusensis]|uniref:(2,3-dihydroxybenzoyl)adenylate synthase n=1 Tax=Kitasatospora kazusensis TaxID=407974 RepID=A0ABP5KUL0_9ACTN